MKRGLHFLFPVATAALGYSFGMLERETPGEASDGKDRGETVHPTPVNDPRESAEADITAALTALTQRGNFREIARLGALLEKLDSAQMHALLDRMDRWPTAERARLLPRIFAYWTQRDPAAATEWMQPRLGIYARDKEFGNYPSIFDSSLVEAWAVNAPEMAVEFARKIPGNWLARKVLHDAIFAWPDKNYARRMEVVRSFPEGNDRTGIVVSLFFTWAQMDRAAALAAAASLPPGPERDGGLGEILVHWAGAKPAEAFAKVAEFGIGDPYVLTVMAKEAAKSDPALAARWLEKQGPALFPEIGSVITKFWAERDPAAAFAWAHEHGISLVKTPDLLRQNSSTHMMSGSHNFEIGGQSPFCVAMEKNPDATLAWMHALPAGPERERFTELALQSVTDTNQAQALFRELSPESAARHAGTIAARLPIEEAQRWAGTLADPAAREAAWTALGQARETPLEIPPGPDRDAMLSGMAQRLGFNSPDKSLARAMEIENPALRRRTFDDVLWKVFRGPVDLGGGMTMGGASEAAQNVARAWVKSANVPDEWKQPWRSKLSPK